VISMTSSWQQQAEQVEQVTAGSAICVWGMVFMGRSVRQSTDAV